MGVHRYHQKDGCYYIGGKESGGTKGVQADVVYAQLFLPTLYYRRGFLGACTFARGDLW